MTAMAEALPPARRALLQVYHAALAAVHGRRCVSAALGTGTELAAPVYVIALGKAALAMAAGAHQALGERLAGSFIVTKAGVGETLAPPPFPAQLRSAGHPLPDERSVAAGQDLLAYLHALPPTATLLFLISGGASSLVEVLAPGVSLVDLQRLNRWLLGSGWDIHAINALRKQVSAIKGGRLLAEVGGRRTLQLLISDVIGNDLSVIGSGLLVPGTASSELLASLALPPWVQDMLARVPHAPPTTLVAPPTMIVADAQGLRRQAVQEAERLGYEVHVHEAWLRGEARQAGLALANELLNAAPGFHIWTGETTVTLPAQPGRGGRCQSLALAAAQRLAGHANIYLLAAGTDGSDGPGQDAGAMVDGATLQRGQDAGYDAELCLDRADAGSFLEGSGDLLNTGPTGTNVMDVVLAIVEP